MGLHADVCESAREIDSLHYVKGRQNIIMIKDKYPLLNMVEFFKFKLMEDIGHICGALIPLFWTSGDASSGFQNKSGLPSLGSAEDNMLHIPWDSSLV